MIYYQCNFIILMITDGGSYCRHFVSQQKRIPFSEYKPPKIQKKLQGCFYGLTLAKKSHCQAWTVYVDQTNNTLWEGVWPKLPFLKMTNSSSGRSPRRDVVWHRHPSPCGTRVAAGTGHAPGCSGAEQGAMLESWEWPLAGLQVGGPTLPDEEGCLRCRLPSEGVWGVWGCVQPGLPGIS